MRNLIGFAILAFLTAISFGCRATFAPSEQLSAEAAELLAGGHALTGARVTERGTVLFCAEGSSIVAKADSPVDLLEARCAAATMAKANLLALIKGEEVEGHMTAGDLMFENQEAVVRVEGFLARAIITFPETSATEGRGLVTACAAVELSRRQLRALGVQVK